MQGMTEIVPVRAWKCQPFQDLRWQPPASGPAKGLCPRYAACCKGCLSRDAGASLLCRLALKRIQPGANVAKALEGCLGGPRLGFQVTEKQEEHPLKGSRSLRICW